MTTNIFSIPVNQDFKLAVAKGMVPGHKLVATAGFSSIVDTSKRIIWTESVPYILPTVAGGMTVSSDSAQDAAGGTGASSIGYEGLDINFNPLNLDNRGFPGVTFSAINGTTPVVLPSSLFRVNQGFIPFNALGSSGSNVGNIYIGTGTVTAGKPAVVISKINSGEGFETISRRTTPNNYFLFPAELQISIEASKNFSFQLKLEFPGGGSFSGLPFTVSDGLSTYARPKAFPSEVGGTLLIQGTVSQQTGTVQTNDEYYLIHTDYVNL